MTRIPFMTGMPPSKPGIEEPYALRRKTREKEMYQSNWSSFGAPARSRFLAIAAFAGLSALQVHSVFAQDAREYPAGPGDQLQVVVFGEENTSSVLSGRFRIEQDGSIYYPLLGKITVAGLSAVEVAKLLGDSLSTQVSVNPPTVSVVEFAPVYLVGDVMRSGPFQFQPNMTVFQLVLQAGGISREGGSEAARLSLLQEVFTLELSDFSFRLQRARLVAELDGADFDDGALAPPPAAEVASIVSAEASIFALRQRAKESRRRTYAAQREGYEQEISSIEKSIILHDEEVRLMEEQVGVQQGLADRGLTAHSARRDAQRQLAATRREALSFGLHSFAQSRIELLSTKR
ncbi:hypothetical protein X759_31140 [Mesorhizobium sp. LSHC420B00]|nr:hypothetical protein X759_31140 [Mesorhizobium sp. LSHC420B00]